MGIKLLAIVPPGCVTNTSNKGRRGGDGREMWVWVGAGWQGTSRSGFKQAGERQKGEECHFVLCPYLPFFCFFPLHLSLSVFLVAVQPYSDSIFPPFSTIVISLISLCCSGSLSYNRHNKAMLWLLLIPTIHPSLAQTSPVARETFRHISTGQLCDHLTHLTGPRPREEHSLQKENT